MPRVKFDLTEQFSDLRSNEIAYKFTIENQGSAPVELYTITTRIPDNVKLIEVNDPSLGAVKSKYSNLCSELTFLINDHISISSQELRNKRSEALKEILEGYAKKLRGELSFWSVLDFADRYRKRTLNDLEKQVEEATTKYDSLHIKIEHVEHAQQAFEKFLIQGDVDINLREVFATKLNQLKELDGKIGKDLASSSLTTIESDSYFAATYVLKFPRSLIDANKFKIDIEVSYAETGKPERYVGGTSASVIISPQPFVLTLVSILGSIFGVILKTSTNTATNSTSTLGSDLLQTVTGGLLISAIILAIIFYNVYEFTDIGKRFNKIGVSWRSALFIGALCGLFSEQIIAAIKGFIGK